MGSDERKKIEKGLTFTSEEKADKYRAIYYAGASGDFNPIHIDPDFGEMVGLGGAILHGMCTLGFCSKAITGLTGDPGKLKRLKCRFSAPVLIEDTVTILGEVYEIIENRAKVTLKVTRQTGEEVLTGVTAEIEV